MGSDPGADGECLMEAWLIILIVLGAIVGIFVYLVVGILFLLGVVATVEWILRRIGVHI